jgi:preprotein translocase subunit SecY
LPVCSGVKQEFSQFFGGTSLLIIVGVFLDTLQQVESHLLMRHYDGLLNPDESKAAEGVPLIKHLLIDDISED